VFARQYIPKGTIVYVKDHLEISIDPVSLLSAGISPSMSIIIVTAIRSAAAAAQFQ
jgi:hypothetical protein